MLASLYILSLVAGPIRPCFESLAMLFVLFPLALIACPVQMAVNSKSMCLVVLPRAVVHISISMDQSALSVRFVVHPVALIHGAVGPYLDTAALSDLGIRDPFAVVACAVLQHNRRPLLPRAQDTLEL